MPKRKDYPNKVCRQCGAPFNRSRSKNGRVESAYDFSVRKFCSHACYYEWNVGTNHYLYKPEGSVRYDGYIRKSVSGERIYAHRLVMEKHLGRPLSSDEHVHHLDGNAENNDISNLQLTTNSSHLKMHYQEWKSSGHINDKGQFT